MRHVRHRNNFAISALRPICSLIQTCVGQSTVNILREGNSQVKRRPDVDVTRATAPAAVPITDADPAAEEMMHALEPSPQRTQRKGNPQNSRRFVFVSHSRRTGRGARVACERESSPRQPGRRGRTATNEQGPKGSQIPDNLSFAGPAKWSWRCCNGPPQEIGKIDLLRGVKRACMPPHISGFEHQNRKESCEITYIFSTYNVSMSER